MVKVAPPGAGAWSSAAVQVLPSGEVAMPLKPNFQQLTARFWARLPCCSCGSVS